MGVELRSLRERCSVREFHRIGNLGPDFQVHGLEVLLGQNFPLEEPFHENRDGIVLFGSLLHFLPRPVGP